VAHHLFRAIKLTQQTIAGSIIGDAASIFTDVTSVGGKAFTIITEAGHDAFTLATGRWHRPDADVNLPDFCSIFVIGAGGVVTSIAGSVFTVATAAGGSIAGEVFTDITSALIKFLCSLGDLISR
jgi:hypothetical protein